MIRVLLILLIVGLSIFLLTKPSPSGEGFVVLISCLSILWIISLIVKDASIIDIFWGIGFVIVAWFYRTRLHLTDTRSLVYCLLISIWGLRLSLHLAFRNIGKGEDYRYQEWRNQYKQSWWWVSFFRVFLLQGVLLWIISSVFVPAISKSTSTLNVIDYLGILLWTIGFAFEAIGDWQLTQFKKDPTNKGQLLQTGLWALTRHPNYFGDALLWWGFYLFAFSNSGYIYVFSPAIMTFLLMKVSGVALLEQKLQATKPQYADYSKNVPAFFPKLF